MLLLKVSPKEKIQKIKVKNILSTMDTKYEFEYANEIYMPSANSTSVNIYPYFREEFYIKNRKKL